MTDWTSLTYVVVDVEGNGAQPPDVVELAAVPIVRGVIGEPVSWLVHPQLPITFLARKIHGISNEAVAGAPRFEAIEPDVTAVLAADALVAHNAHVDVSVLQGKFGDKWECPEVFDTLSLARRLAPGLDSYKLGRLVEEFGLADGLPDDLAPHRATYDALVAARLFTRLAVPPGMRARTLEELRNEPGGGEDGAATLF